MDKAPEAFRTISEVAEMLQIPAHVLRFWESRFTQIKPVKRAGGRRYYRRADIRLLDGIRRLLHDEGMTIRGVQKLLREDGIRSVAALATERAGPDDEADDTGTEAPMAADVPLASDTGSRVVPFLRRSERPARPEAMPLTADLFAANEAENAPRPLEAAGSTVAQEAPARGEAEPESKARDQNAESEPALTDTAPSATEPSEVTSPETEPETEPERPIDATEPAMEDATHVGVEHPAGIEVAREDTPAGDAASAAANGAEAIMPAVPSDPGDDDPGFAAPTLDLGKLPRDPDALRPWVERLLALRQRMDRGAARVSADAARTGQDG